MCGIAGFVGAPRDEVLAAMTAALTHRGPDAGGDWADRARGVFFGHRRLSILDHAGGAQPMATSGGDLVVVFNGEIYNAPGLRRELEGRGHRFVSDHSDTEVLLHGFREWGPALVSRLNGMWAFVLYDRRAGRLFGGRDRMGEKPLFYAETGEDFVFASELGALRRHPAIAGTISRRALQKYYAYGYIPAPVCILEGVSKLPAGHTFDYDLVARRLVVSAYWTFQLEPQAPPPRDAEGAWGEELRALLDQAVRRRLVADVPVGIFLSGGIDSSAVTAFAARTVPAGELATFNIGFTEPSFDESAPARRVAEWFGTRHLTATLDLAAARDQLSAIAAHLDEPLGDASLLPTDLLSGFARRHVTVALGGDGGDELFAGYDPFLALRRAEWYARMVPRPVHQAIRLLAARLPVSHRNMSFDFKVKRVLRGLGGRPALWLPLWMAPLEPRDIAELLAEPVDEEDVFSEAIALWEACPQENVVDRTLQFFTRLYLADNMLVKIDRASMRHGLEVRSPFLDNEVVDFARRLPGAWKLRGRETKYLLKRALAPLLPRDVIDRPKKGFGVPIGAWFRTGELVLETSALPRELNPAFVQRAAAAHRAGTIDHRAFLWNTWLLERWCRAAGS